jgi:hypothetical protein
LQKSDNLRYFKAKEYSHIFNPQSCLEEIVRETLPKALEELFHGKSQRKPDDYPRPLLDGP